MPTAIPTVKSPIGERLRTLREGAGLTQSSLAKLASTTPITIYRIESGRSLVGVAILSRIAKALADGTGQTVGSILAELVDDA